MGTIGLGGLHRKSTWLYPVATVALLPPTAMDGSVAVALDSNIGYQFDSALPGWLPFAGTSRARTSASRRRRKCPLLRNGVLVTG